MSDNDPMAQRAASRERAAFQVSIHSTVTDGRVVWETQAYHEESDTKMAWPGPPGEPLISWLCSIVGLPEPTEPTAEAQPAEPTAEAQPTEPTAEAQPAEPGDPTTNGAAATPADEQRDDFTQIIGMGAVTERQLHAAGIHTYAQLAAYSPAELGALLNIPPERIARRGWITRARALARLATLPPAPAAPAPEEERAPPAPPSATVLVEVLFDEEGGILEQRLIREGEPPAPAPGHGEGQVARFFVESAAPLGDAPIELAAELDGLELEQIPAADGGPPRLRANSRLSVAGLGASLARREGAEYLAYIVAHELETDKTRVLQGASGRLSPDRGQEPITLELGLPAIGRYQMLLVVLLAGGAALSAATGPRLRVNP